MAIVVGKKISEELYLYIETWTTVSEYQDIADNHNLSIETVRAVSKRSKKINETNLPVLLDVIRLAIKNRTELHKRLTAGHREANREVNNIL